MVTKLDYGKNAVEASYSVMVELIHILGEFKDSIVIIGGSVPPLLFPHAEKEYIGTLDVDLALDHHRITGECYQTIRKILLERGYREGRQPFIFYRDVPGKSGNPITVQVDLLSGEYGGTGRSHRTQHILDTRARKARGCDLAFADFKPVDLQAELPGGGLDQVTCRIAAVVPFIIMKSMALAERMKEKDAWDIYFAFRHYQAGLDALVNEFRPQLKNGLVKEGLGNLKAKFASADHIGPKHVADFEAINDPEDRARIQRDAFERINYLLQQLQI